ncbi:MAG: 3-deoxy-D-manno-octulosonic acid transferase [Deltaproteobacteria bacterium]|nr:3-deoxy-D-manno-octulosonic acid transferase [Deltaproteobacteria bacterium]MBW2192333.1 3-deoxy-D-manno-octulosonic acid transferase [Deltaproteobacteria bacterium]
MNVAYRAYRVLSTCLFLTLFPFFYLYSRITGRHHESLSQRLGIYPDSVERDIDRMPRIWIHAASVGEVRVAEAIIAPLAGLIPNCTVILSTTTDHGQALARDTLGKKVTCVYAPLDYIGAARRALTAVRPDVLVCLETEIWPNWLMEAHRTGVRTAMVNGRISVRSIKGYLRVRPLMQETLKTISAFSMISEADSRRIRMMGAPHDRVTVNGNAKYDLLLRHVDTSLKTKMNMLYNVIGDKPVFVAGSTRNSEENIILDVYQQILRSVPETLLIIAPRHVNRAHYIAGLVQERGLTYQFRTELDGKDALRTAPVVIVDTIGELKATYGIATIVFCGGSLVPLGGQNILEAAVWGKPVLYGPSMDDFLDAKHLLDQTGGGIQVKDGQELAEKVIYYLTNPETAKRIGESARKAVVSHQGAAEKHAAVIFQLLSVHP